MGAQKRRRDGSFEYPQHMFLMRNEENNFLVRTLILRPELWLPDVCKIIEIRSMYEDVVLDLKCLGLYIRNISYFAQYIYIYTVQVWVLLLA